MTRSASGGFIGSRNSNPGAYEDEHHGQKRAKGDHRNLPIVWLTRYSAWRVAVRRALASQKCGPLRRRGLWRARRIAVPYGAAPDGGRARLSTLPSRVQKKRAYRISHTRRRESSS